MKPLIRGCLALLLFIFCTGCGTDQDGTTRDDAEEAIEAAAVSKRFSVINQEGKTIGFIELFQSVEKGVDIHLSAGDLPPGALAFHIFEKAECVPPSFESAGSVFNPTNKEHGFDNPKGPYAGDLPNIEVGADGKVDVVVNAPDVTLGKGKLSLLDKDGSAFIIHSRPDDYFTNPSGNSGERIGCGFLKIDEPR